MNKNEKENNYNNISRKEWMYIYMYFLLSTCIHIQNIYTCFERKMHIYISDIYIDITYLYNACKKQINDIINPSLTVILCTYIYLYIDIDPARQ